MNTRKPALGDTILYVLREGHSAGQSRAAVITRTWHPLDGVSLSVNLTIHLDKANDYSGPPPEHYASSAPYDGSGATPGSWHWPADAERLEAAAEQARAAASQPAATEPAAPDEPAAPEAATAEQ